jgi:hypothetical protein
MAEARQTPRGARPNRRGELARLAESVLKERAPFCAAQATWKDEPSGRLLEPHREVRPRGMIVTKQAREGRYVQNPAYRFIRQFFLQACSAVTPALVCFFQIAIEALTSFARGKRIWM